MKTVLVLGSSGVIGSSLCKRLRRDNYEVIEWDIKKSFTQDLTNPIYNGALKREIERADFIFFLAYDVGGAKYISNVDIDFVNRNVMIMLNTFNLLENKKFVFASSTMYNMDNVYGILKHLGEKYTTLLGGISTRLWNVYGCEESSEKSHVIADMIHKWKTNGYVELLTSGEEERQLLHADDCAEAFIRIMENYGDIPTSIDISSFEWTKIKDVAKLICDDVRVTDVTVTTHDRQNVPRDTILKYWKPKIDLKTGIQTIIDGQSN